MNGFLCGSGYRRKGGWDGVGGMASEVKGGQLISSMG